MFIAGKFQEINPPIGSDYLRLANDRYSMQELLAFEYLVLSALQFDINVTPLATFLENFATMLKLTDQAKTVKIVASFLGDMFLREPEFLDFPTSLVSVVCLHLALKMEVAPRNPFAYNYHKKLLQGVLKNENFSLQETKACKFKVMKCLLRQIENPAQCLLFKYGRTMAHIFKIMP